jgi:hypothetical protein
MLDAVKRVKHAVGGTDWQPSRSIGIIHVNIKINAKDDRISKQ